MIAQNPALVPLIVRHWASETDGIRCQCNLWPIGRLISLLSLNITSSWSKRDRHEEQDRDYISLKAAVARKGLTVVIEVPVADRRLTVKGNHIFSGVVQLTTDWHRLILKKNSEVTALVHIDKVGIGNVFWPLVNRIPPTMVILIRLQVIGM